MLKYCFDFPLTIFPDSQSQKLNFVSEISCNSFPSVTHAYTTDLITYYVDTVLSYVCLDGYTYRDGSVVNDLYCMDDGTWDGPALTKGCEPVSCGAIPYIENSILTNTPAPNYPARVTYKCTTGYRLQQGGSMYNTTCLANATWSSIDLCTGEYLLEY